MLFRSLIGNTITPLPLSGNISFVAVAVDNDGGTSTAIAGSTAIATAVPPPTLNGSINISLNNVTKIGTLAIGFVIPGRGKSKITFFGDFNDNGNFDNADKKLGQLDVGPNTSQSFELPASVLTPLLGKIVFAKITTDQGFFSGILIGLVKQ